MSNLIANAHSTIGASSMSRWSKCPGSVALSKDIPKTSSVYADEGTEAHELAASILLGQKVDKEPDDEMLENVSVYVNYVKSLQRLNAKSLIEHKFDLSKLHPGLFGTADAVVYIPEKKLLHVVDLKYGAGVAVEVTNNPQLQYYGLGALISTNYPCVEIELTIVQPRLNHSQGPIRSQRLGVMELMDFSADLIDYAKATEKPNAKLVSGSHCKFCPAKALCPELSKTAIEKAKDEFSAITPYSPEKLAETLTLLPQIEAWAKGVREFAYSEAQHGRCPPGFKLVAKRVTRKWKNEDDAVKHLEWNLRLKADDIFEPPAIKSVAQIEKLVGKEKFKSDMALNDLISQESSGNSLVEEADPRAPIKNDAKSQFTIIHEQDT